jgi:hypothetical protein
MSVFNFIETFFLISLGITFVLIMFLVYHFRQRLDSLDQKQGTMFEIINNIIKEITMIKQAVSMNAMNSIPFRQPSVPLFRASNLDQIKENDHVDEDSLHPSDETSETNSDGVDTDDDDEEEEVDEDEDDEDDDIVIEKIPVSDSEEEAEEEDNGLSTVKVINLDINATFDVNEIPSLDEEQLNAEDELLVTEDEVVELSSSDADPIIVSKQIEEVPSAHEPAEKEDDMEVYRKMNLSSLKALLITKGLRSDVSKLKKQDILKILEGAQE